VAVGSGGCGDDGTLPAVNGGHRTATRRPRRVCKGGDPVLPPIRPFGHPARRTTCASGFECAHPDALSTAGSGPRRRGYRQGTRNAKGFLLEPRNQYTAETAGSKAHLKRTEGQDHGKAHTPHPFTLFCDTTELFRKLFSLSPPPPRLPARHCLLPTAYCHCLLY